MSINIGIVYLIMTVINIGRGSSNFYCNLIKSYLRNHSKVSVVAGGLRINLGIWVCYLIKSMFRVEKVNVHFVEDDRMHTIFTFEVYNDAPVVRTIPEMPPCDMVLRIRHAMDMKYLREQLNDVNSIDIIASGTLCYRALFLTTFAYKKGFRRRFVEDIDIHWAENKVGVRIQVYKCPNVQ